MNVPKQVDVGQPARTHLIAALFTLDLNSEESDLIGLSAMTGNRFPDSTTLCPGPVNGGLLIPVRFDHRQQLTVRLYGSGSDQIGSGSIQDQLQSLSANLIGEAVFGVRDLIVADGGQQQMGVEMGVAEMGGGAPILIRPLRTVSGSGLVHDSRPMQISVQYRERHHNNRVAKLLITCNLQPAYHPSAIDRLGAAPTWRLEATRDGVLDVDFRVRTSVLRTEPLRAHTPTPSWFVDAVAVDALIPAEISGDPLRVKLWRTGPLDGAARLFGEAFIKRGAILKWIADVEQDDRADAAHRKDTGHSPADRLSIIGTAPKQLEADMHALDDESVRTASLTLEANRIGRAFSLFEYLSAGLRLHLTVAVDTHVSNGDPVEVSSLHYDDPRQIDPSPYMRCMRPVMQFLIPYAQHIYPIGFAGRIANQTNAADQMGFFHICRSKPSGLVQTLDEYTAAYRDALPALTLGRHRVLGPVLAHAIETASHQTAARSYAIVIVFTNGVPDDLPQCAKIIQDAAHVPISFVIVGVEPGRTVSRLQAQFERALRPERRRTLVAAAAAAAARTGPWSSSDRRNVQFVWAGDGADGQAGLRLRNMMDEIESQALAYMVEHRIAPAVVRPILPPLQSVVPAGTTTTTATTRPLSEFVPIASGVQRVLSRKPSLNRKVNEETGPNTGSTGPTSQDSETSDKSARDQNEFGVIGTGKSRVMISREPSATASLMSSAESGGPSPGLSRVPSRGPPDTSTARRESQPKEQTEFEIQRDKENAANAIRDRYRQSPQKGVLEHKARTNLRDSIQLKLAVGAYDWKRAASVVSETVVEARAASTFLAPHQTSRFHVRPNQPESRMPRTIFNRRDGAGTADGPAAVPARKSTPSP